MIIAAASEEKSAVSVSAPPSRCSPAFHAAMLRRSSPAPPARLSFPPPPASVSLPVPPSDHPPHCRRSSVAAGIAVASMALAGAGDRYRFPLRRGDAVGRAAAELPNSLSLPVPPVELSPDLPAA